MNFRNVAKRLEDDEVFLVYLHIFYPNMLLSCTALSNPSTQLLFYYTPIAQVIS